MEERHSHLPRDADQGISKLLHVLQSAGQVSFLDTKRVNANKTCLAPTALSNGPTILECQVDFVVDCIAKLEKEGATTIEPTEKAMVEWRQLIIDMADKTLFPLTRSWWSGAPGKKPEMLMYVNGIPMYERECQAALDGWKGFEIDGKDAADAIRENGRGNGEPNCVPGH